MRTLITTIFILLHLSTLAENLGTDEQRVILEKGYITATKKVDDATWPEVIIKSLIKTTPLTAVAIFAAYDYQKNYVPGLLKSKIHKVTSPTQIQVSYELKMPWPLSNGVYINDHKLSSPHQGSYKVSWKNISNSSAKDVNGSATFLPFPGKKGYTLMTYRNHVVPDSMFAGVLRKLMVKDVEKSISATVKATETLSNQKSTLLLKYESKIIDALKGKAPYKL
jgi:hypothetical protein